MAPALYENHHRAQTHATYSIPETDGGSALLTRHTCAAPSTHTLTRSTQHARGRGAARGSSLRLRCSRIYRARVSASSSTGGVGKSLLPTRRKKKKEKRKRERHGKSVAGVRRGGVGRGSRTGTRRRARATSVSAESPTSHNRAGETGGRKSGDFSFQSASVSGRGIGVRK